MRKVFAVTAAAVLLSNCGTATAAPRALDPTNDLDCSLTAYVFYMDATKIGAPESAKKGLLITTQWFAARAKARGDKSTDAEESARFNMILSDINAAKVEMKSCMNRAVEDREFAHRMGVQR